MVDAAAGGEAALPRTRHADAPAAGLGADTASVLAGLGT